MATARALLYAALKEPMAEAGWTPKAAGWFVRPVTPDALAVVAATMATKHAARGEGWGAAYLGLRVQTVEDLVARMLGSKDNGYQARTTNKELGQATGRNRWLSWHVTEQAAGQVARDMTALIADDGWRYLDGLARDADALLAAVKSNPDSRQSRGFARMVVLLASMNREDEARRFMHERLRSAEGRSDAVAVEEREAAQALQAWLDEPRG